MSTDDAVWHDYHADEGVCVEPKDGVYDNGGSPANTGEQESWTGYVDVEAYSSEQILSLVEIAPAPGKGRCMYTRRAYEPGEIIIIEKPLFAITPDSNSNIWDTLMTLHQEQPLHLPPLWHHAALVSILEGNEEKLEIMKGKWVLDNDPPVSEDVYRILEVTCAEHRDGSFVYHNGTVICPNLYQFLLQVWPLNAFAHSTHPQGLVIYDKISYLAHSCDSSATWNHYGEDIFVLRARRKLQIGDELTISYIGEADLLAPTPSKWD
uniref:SET domain-containing protein n=1 Tax=Babesia bovis TaxID=5865 RepID=A7ASB7_BABBO|eukprot:XP_001611004.1 hypothetical protein [Babesia bovis T2Bo]